MASGVNFGTQQYFNFDPRAIPGCVLWLDGADSNVLFTDSAGTISVGSSGNIGMWKDKSGVGRNYIQATSGNRPSFANNTVTCSTSSQLLTSTVALGIAGIDIFVVGKPLPAAGNSWRTLLRGGTTDHPILVETGATRLGYFVNGIGFNPFGSLTLDGSARALLYVSIPASRIASAALNGTVTLSSGTNAMSASADLQTLGNNTGAGQPWGDINEVIFLSNTTSSQRQQVEGYLAWKWNIQATLPTSHPFKGNPPAMRLFQPVDVLNCAVWVDPADRSSILALSGNQPTSIRSKGHQLITLDNAQPVNNTGSGPWIGWPPPSVTNYGTQFMTNASSNLNTLQFTRTVGGPGGQYGNGYNGSYLRIPSITFTSQQRTIFFVHSPQAVGIDNYAHIFAPTNFSGTTNMRQRGFLDYTGTAYIMFPVTDGSTQVLVAGATAPYTGTMPTNGTPYIFALRHTTSTTSNYTSINGNSLTPPTNQALSTGYLTGTDEYAIGIFIAYTRQFLMGDFLLYDGAIQTSEIQQIEGYLAWKWGLRTSLPTTHPFYKFPPATALFVPTLISNCALWFDAADVSTTTTSLTISFNIFVTTSAQPVSYSGTLSGVSDFTGGTVVMNGAQIGAPSGSSARSGVWAPSATSGRWYAFVIDGGYCKTVLCQFVLTGTTLTVQGISTGFTSTVANYLSSANSGATNDSYYATYDTSNPIATSAFTTGYGVQSFVMNAVNSTGTTIPTWQNKGTFGGTASGGVSPTRTTNGIVFNGTSQYLATTYSAVPTAETFFGVATWTGTTDRNYCIIGTSATNGRNFNVQQYSSGAGRIIKWDRWGVAGYAPTSGVQPNVQFLASGIFTGSAGQTAFNGGSLSSSASFSFAGSGTTNIGAGVLGDYFAGTINEVIVYSSVLTDSERKRVEGYLAWKWGLRDKLPDSHPYYKFRP